MASLFKKSASFRRWILHLCRDNTKVRLNLYATHTEVIRAGNLAIKFGHVTIEEACNQREASLLLDKAIVHVPKVFDFFVVDDCGFLVMEYVDGRHPHCTDYPTVVPQIGACLAHLHSFERSAPGPFHGGESHGIIWTDDEVRSFATTESLNCYLNSRLIKSSECFAFGDDPMVLCHLDAAPRNILLAEDGIWLLDWASAGFYPRSFEFCAIRLNYGSNGEDTTYANMLENSLAALLPMSPLECREASLMQMVAGNNIRFTL